MASYNKVFLMGNLTRDPQVKHLPSDMVVAEFGLAVNRRYRTAAGEEKEEVAFVDCTAFGRQAETLAQYCTKGKPIFIEGRLKWDTWDDKQGGGKRSKLTVVVENFQFLPDGSRGGGQDDAGEPPARQDRGGQGSRAGASVAAAGANVRNRPKAVAPFGDESHFDSDDVPFLWEGPRRSAV